MKLVIVTTILILLVTILLDATKVENNAIILNRNRDKYYYSTVLISAFSIILIIAEGFRFGYMDTANYKGIYSYLPDSFSVIWQTSDHVGFDVFQLLLKRISTNPQILIIVVALFVTFADVYFIKKYAFNIPFSLYLYFLSSFISNMNGIRQIFAATILMLAFDWLVNKKWIRYFLLIFLLSTVHKSILTVIPLSILIMGKRFNKGLIFFLLFCAFSVPFPQIINFLIGSLVSDDYSHYLTTYTASANLLHIVVDAVPLFLCICYHFQNKQEESEDRVIDVFINMLVIRFGFMALATTMAQYARIGMYMRNVTAILVPFLIEKVVDDRKDVIKICAIVLYFLEFFLVILSYNSNGYFEYLYLDFSIFGW